MEVSDSSVDGKFYDKLTIDQKYIENLFFLSSISSIMMLICEIINTHTHTQKKINTIDG